MPRPRNPDEESPPVVTAPPPWTPPTETYAPGENPNHIIAPSRWNQDLWGNDPEPGDPYYDRPDYPETAPITPGPDAPGSGAAGDDDGGWSKKPRHMQIYGGPGYNPDGTLREAENASGGGSAGSGSGAGSSGSGSSSGSGTGTTPPGTEPGDWGGLSETIINGLNAILSGDDVPFSQDVLERQKAALFAATQGQAGAAQDTINRDLIRRGVFRSGIAADAEQGLQRAALQQYGQGVNAAQIEGAKENYQARMNALDRAQKHLDSYRQYILQKEMNETERQKALDTIKLGYARINADITIADKQIAAAKKGGGGGSSYNPIDAFIQQQLLGGTPAPTAPF